MKPPKTQYARSGDFSIAYQVVGDGPLDLVHIPGLVSHLDHAWTHPKYVRFMRLLSSFARVIVYDKRGTGLSDPFIEPPSVEERIDDTRAVMDAVGSDRAAVFGCSEGATLAAFFAATYPERVSSAILYGSFARLTPDPPDYPWGFDDFMMSQFTLGGQEAWGEGVILTILAPSFLADDDEREWWGGYERTAISPRVLRPMTAANVELDIRAILPAIRVPTLLLHRTGDMLPIEGARYMAERIPGARLIEMEGDDHWPWMSDPEEVCGHVEEFVTGGRHEPETDRVLATVLFTDIVGSTERASEIGDRRWRELLERHERCVSARARAPARARGEHHGRRLPRDLRRPGTRDSLRARRAATAIRALGIEIRAGIHTGECELPRRGHRRDRGPHRGPRDGAGRTR